MGIAGASVAIVAGIASLAVSPALLALWGAQAARRKRDRGAAPQDRWHRFAHAVMRRPGTIAVVTAAVMLAVALPALGVKWTPVDATAIPTDQSSRVVADAIERDFGGAGATPVTVAVTAPSSDAAAVQRVRRQVRGVEGVRSVAVADLGGDTWRLDRERAGRPGGRHRAAVVHGIRALDPAFETAVTGPAAEFIDQQAAIGSRLPFARAAARRPDVPRAVADDRLGRAAG